MKDTWLFSRIYNECCTSVVVTFDYITFIEGPSVQCAMFLFNIFWITNQKWWCSYFLYVAWPEFYHLLLHIVVHYKNYMYICSVAQFCVPNNGESTVFQNCFHIITRINTSLFSDLTKWHKPRAGKATECTRNVGWCYLFI